MASSRFFIALGAILSSTLALGKTPGPTNAILVDKKTNSLQLVNYIDGAYELVKEYHVTLGQVKGDKENEDDLKTPEGIYTFTTLLKPPHLKAKFGVMAFYVNYPNAFDSLAGRTGFDIMLHATNEPDRLKQNYDSLGCVVVKNEELQEIAPQIRLGLTPILIFPELTKEYRAPGQNPTIRSFFESWIKAWETEDLESYINHYHSDFSAQGMDRDKWKSYKGGLNKKYKSIVIGPEDVRYYSHPKYWMVTFSQNYHSIMNWGATGHKSRGTKILYIAEEAGKPKIIAETYTQMMW